MELRPRERAMKEGVANLNNTELIAILIRTGSKEKTAVNLANEILVKLKGINGLGDVSIEELVKIQGMGYVKALTLICALELGRRLSKSRQPEFPIISKPADAAILVKEELRYLKKEHFKILILNTKNHVIAMETISIGSLNSSIVHPRELFRKAIQHAAAAVILVHNHPSGEVTPSNEDLKVTKRIVEAGRIIGIEVLDHIIIAGHNYLSFKEDKII